MNEYVVDFKNHPKVDWSDPLTRKKMDQALDSFERRILFAKYIPIIIGGKEYYSDKTIEVKDPARRSRMLIRAHHAEEKNVRRAARIAYVAFFKMNDGDFFVRIQERKKVVEKAIKIMDRDMFDIASEVVFEVSKSQTQSLMEVEEAIDFARLYYDFIDSVYAPVVYQAHLHSEKNVLYRFPKGPVAAISTWNFPFSLMASKVFAAYLTGCPVIMKPAEQSIIAAYRLWKIMIEAGADPASIALLPGHGDVGEALVKHPFIAKICFTGSLTVGNAIRKTVADVLAEDPYRFPFGKFADDLELGGNNPIVITQFADVDESLRGALAKFKQAGQKCSSPQRLICVGNETDPYWKHWFGRFIPAVKSLEWGHPADRKKRFEYNALIDNNARDRVKRIIQEAERVGKTIVKVDLGTLGEKGNYVGPAVFSGIPHDSSLVREEVFGPVLFVFFVPTLKRAVHYAGKYPHITAAIFSQSKNECDFFVREMIKKGTGNIYVNRSQIGAEPGRQLFGGRRMAGTGKIGTLQHLLSFTDEVTVTENRLIQGVLSNV